MDILAGLRDKLRFIERHYATASEPFRETKRKIEAGEAPYESPPFDPETDDLEPPFQEEWEEAIESLNIEGQAALKLVQGALREYLRASVDMYGIPLTAKGKNWLAKYKKHFHDVCGIDWDEAPVPVDELEEVNLARNDVEHGGEAFGMTRRQGPEHERRFPAGLFVNEMHKQRMKRSVYPGPGRIYVTAAGIKEAFRRVECFCEYLDSKRPY
jgi:hypothetical protein